MKKRLNCSRSSGVALIGIIAAIVLLGLLGTGVLMLVTTGSMESLQTLNWNKAFFAAETGISVAKYQMSTNAVWYTALPWTRTGMIGQASFSCIIATNDGTNVAVTSTGIQGDARWTTKWYPSASEVARAVLVYQQSGQSAPRYRTCSSLRKLGNELTANSVAATPQWQCLEANPNTNEFILAAQNSSRYIYAQVYAGGTWGPATQLNAAGRVPAASSRGFDVAYENLSGRGMVVYSDGSKTPQYRLWVSNSWSSPLPINVGASNGVYWIRLIPKPGTNEIMCLARWRAGTRNYSSGIIWNGATWIGLTNLEYNCDSDIARETLDGAYSTNMALVVYINGSGNARRIPKYKIYNAISGTWSGESNMVSLGTVMPRWIRVEYSSDGSLAYVGILHSGTGLKGTYRRGSAWDAYYDFGSLDTVNRRTFDIAWSSQTNTLMVVYSPNQNAQSYLLATGGGSSNQYGSLVSTDDGQWCLLKADPFTSEFYYLAIDDANDVNFQRWTGSSWTLFPEPENGSSLNYLSIDFTFRRDSASANYWPLR